MAEKQWAPHIPDDAKIIELLIRELYGDDPSISIREILQNAHDACVEMHKRGDMSPDVVISVGDENGRRYVSISDTGVGMTRDELQNKLLAIGESDKSTWESVGDDVDSLRKIVSKHAEMIGKYGIGFLASFILADRVVVTTRKTGTGPDEALRLEVRLGIPEPPTETHRKNPGTDVRLFVRPLQSDNRQFNDRVNELLRRDELERYVSKLLYFSVVPIRLATPAGTKLLSMTRPDVSSLDPDDLHKTISGEELGKALASQRYSAELSDKGLETSVFLYLWPGSHVPEVCGHVNVWVNGMLVEANAKECLPNWGDCISGYVVSNDLPLELDRRHAQRTAVEFDRLRRAVLDGCIDLFRKFIDGDFRKFYRDVWPTISGTVLPSALLAAAPDNRHVDPHEREAARRFIREIGPKLPLRVLRLNPTVGGYYLDTMNLEKISKEIERSSGTPRYKVPYLTTLGTIDTAVDPDVIGAELVIDARPDLSKSRSDGEMTEALLRLISDLLPDEYGFEEVSPNIGDELSPDEFRQGWKELQEAVSRFATYEGGGESYIVVVRRFRPTYLPAVAMEVTQDREQTENFAHALQAFVERFPQFKTVMADALSKVSTNDRILTLIINANNKVMEEMARILASGSPLRHHREFLAVLQHQIEDARIDFYGGSFVGSKVQEDVYTNLRVPTYLRYLHMLQHGLDLEGIPVDPEEKHAVVLMADLTGSTEMLTLLDRAEWGKILSPFAERIRAFVESNGGFFDKFTGDGFLALWFDDERQRIAEKVRQLMPPLSAELAEWAGSTSVKNALLNAGIPGEFRVRVAVTYGPVQFGRFGRAGSVAGRCVVLAARLLDGRLPYWTQRYQFVFDELFVHQARFAPQWTQENAYGLPESVTIRNFPSVRRVWPFS